MRGRGRGTVVWGAGGEAALGVDEVLRADVFDSKELTN